MSRISLEKRMHRQLLDMLGAKDQHDAARIIAGFHASHLSAQAKVRVPDAMTIPKRTEAKSFDEAYGNGVADGWNACRIEATRLSQGAQGKPLGYVSKYAIDAIKDGEFAPLIKKRRTKTHCVPVYTHPAERAAVPDGVPCELLEELMWRWKLEAKEHAEKGNYVRCDLTHKHADELKNILTAAPQPPEGARVVDEHAAFQAWWDERLKENRAWPLTPGEGYVHARFSSRRGGMND